MNLLHVIPYYAPAWAYGGVVRAATDLTRALAEAGHTVWVLTTDTLSPAARISAFVDFGNVYDGIDNFDAGELRVSTGVALLWRSPMGPISISYAYPLRKQDEDQIERLQFTFGGQL